jgi:hypothetical protein
MGMLHVKGKEAAEATAPSCGPLRNPFKFSSWKRRGSAYSYNETGAGEKASCFPLRQWLNNKVGPEPVRTAFGQFREHSGHIQGTFRAHSGNIQHVGNIQGTFREHSTCREHSGNIQGTFNM